MPDRRSRNLIHQKKPAGNGRMYIQIILCIVIICSFMVFKDTTLPNGRTPRDYAKQILTTTVNLPEIIARFKDDVAIPASANVAKP